MTPRVDHPGPPDARRIWLTPCRVAPLRVQMEAGAALLDVAQAAPSAWLRFAATMAPLRFVIPADAPDARHAAWYSATHAPPGAVGVVSAGLFTGPRDDAPFLHCHGAWDVAQGARAGHVLPDASRLESATLFEGWQIDGAQMQARHDAETNFTLYRPQAVAPAPPPPPPGDVRAAALVRIAPNEDLCPALVRACREAGLGRARVEGIGSLNGVRMADGCGLPPGPTEFLIREGRIDGTEARIGIVIVDKTGNVVDGVLAATGNPVFVTVEALLVAD